VLRAASSSACHCLPSNSTQLLLPVTNITLGRFPLTVISLLTQHKRPCCPSNSPKGQPPDLDGFAVSANDSHGCCC
jgi:hypothetical protein